MYNLNIIFFYTYIYICYKPHEFFDQILWSSYQNTDMPWQIVLDSVEDIFYILVNCEKFSQKIRMLASFKQQYFFLKLVILVKGVFKFYK